jgi:hypothetical protein
MILILILLSVFIYLRGFWCINFLRDYYLSGKCAQKVINQQVLIMENSQKYKKKLDMKKNKISTKYKIMLLDHDSKMSNKITCCRIYNINKKYHLTNMLNNALIQHLYKYTDELISKKYNQCLFIILNSIIINEHKK